MVVLTAYRGPLPEAQAYTESLLNDERAPDGHPYSLYWVLTLTTQAYMKSLLNDKSAPHGCPYNLYRVLTLTVQAYTEHE